MYKIHSVKIDSFWHRFNAGGQFNETVNIIIGRNGTGKTTFMNILYAVLSVDIDGISANDFKSVSVILINNGNKIKVDAVKTEKSPSQFLNVEYRINGTKYIVQILSGEDARRTSVYRRRALELSEEVRTELSKIVSLSSLSVYRLRSGDEYEIMDRLGSKAVTVTPVDRMLSTLLEGLTRYQLELSQKARSVATSLQRDVLTSILYSDEEYNSREISLEFEKTKETENLTSAYTQLSVINPAVVKKIEFHVASIDTAVNALKSHSKNSNGSKREVNFRALEALQQTKKIIKLSLNAEKETTAIFAQITLFISILEDFVINKKFSFNSGDLKVEANKEQIPYHSLSSGEKQLLIILIETLLQKQKKYIFLMDEPELSLHIEWQREIIPAIMKLNPNAQIIAATHSPEVASKYSDAIFDMEDLVNG